MHRYRAPLRDIDFLLRALLDSADHYAALAGCETVDMDVIDAVIRGAARFSEEVVAPTLPVSDAQGCRYENGEVETKKCVARGFPSSRAYHTPAEHRRVASR